MMKKSLPLPKVYKLIESGPVVMLTTCYKYKFNIMSMSLHMILEFTLPLLLHQGHGKFVIDGKTINSDRQSYV